jgi:hypothetical protein
LPKEKSGGACIAASLLKTQQTFTAEDSAAFPARTLTFPRLKQFNTFSGKILYNAKRPFKNLSRFKRKS